jgi:chromosome partitioning protein
VPVRLRGRKKRNDRDGEGQTQPGNPGGSNPPRDQTGPPLGGSDEGEGVVVLGDPVPSTPTGISEPVAEGEGDEGIVSITPAREEPQIHDDVTDAGTVGADVTSTVTPLGELEDEGRAPGAQAPSPEAGGPVVGGRSPETSQTVDVAAPERISATLGELQDLRGADAPAVEAGDYAPRALPRVIAVANQKGGVGKTTTAVNLGAGLAELGYRVLVVDLDPQANATTGVGLDGRSFDISMYDVLMRDAKLEDAIEPTSMRNLFICPATIDLAGAEIELVPAFSRELKLRRALEPIIGDFDFMLIDCPPSLGLITVNGLAAADEILVPIQCEYYALEGLGQLLRNVELVRANLNSRLDLSTIVLTMYDGRTKLAEQVANEVRTHFGKKVCKNVIPRTVRISEAPSFGQPVTTFDPGSRGAIAYRELAKEVSGGAA